VDELAERAWDARLVERAGLEALEEAVDDGLGLAAEVVGERAARVAGALCDLVDRHGVVAALAHESEGRRGEVVRGRGLLEVAQRNGHRVTLRTPLPSVQRCTVGNDGGRGHSTRP